MSRTELDKTLVRVEGKFFRLYKKIVEMQIISKLQSLTW